MVETVPINDDVEIAYYEGTGNLAFRNTSLKANGQLIDFRTYESSGNTEIQLWNDNYLTTTLYIPNHLQQRFTVWLDRVVEGEWRR